MKVNGIPTRTIWPIEHGQAVGIIDQTKLPFEFVKEECVDWRQLQMAIATMKVRGAPLIGISGAWAMVLAMKEDPCDDCHSSNGGGSSVGSRSNCLGCHACRVKRTFQSSL